MVHKFIFFRMKMFSIVAFNLLQAPSRRGMGWTLEYNEKRKNIF